MKEAHDSQSNFTRLRDEILAVRWDKSFQSGLEQILGDDSRDLMNKRLNKLVDDNLYAAFLGRQGVGKSSLVNALLFKKEILPIDVTETTNVLCKIIHSHGMNPGVTVYFKDGTSKEGPPTRDYLADFVDEQHNPENNKRIQEIILRYPIDYLSEGIAFVDTPGVDSMLSHNMKTTMEFLPQVSCAIFV